MRSRSVAQRPIAELLNGYPLVTSGAGGANPDHLTKI